MTTGIRARLRGLLHLDDPPWRIALALAVGVFIGCTPLWFFQTLLAILVATVFRLNKAATVTGAWLNLPWFAPLVYGASLKIGTLLVPGDATAAAHALDRLLSAPDALDWREALDMLKSASVALFVGTTLVGLLAAVLTYVVALRVITVRRRRRTEELSRERHAA